MYSDFSDAGAFHMGAKARKMQVAEISINACKAGMEVAGEVYSPSGMVVVRKNTILDDHMIERLGRLGIELVKIYDRTEDDVIVDDYEAYIEQYNTNLAIVCDIFQDIRSGKPPDAHKINAVVGSMLERQDEYRNTLQCVMRTFSLDEYIYKHSVNVGLLCSLMARWLHMDTETAKKLIRASLLHDIGSIKVDQAILGKQGKLEPEEWVEVKRHPDFTLELVKDMGDMDDDTVKGMLMHHERGDGSGYPDHLHDADIHKFAKIMAIADVFDAITSSRPYRDRLSPFEAFGMLEDVELNLFDPTITMTFLQNAPTFYIGDKFFLNTGDVGQIVFIHPHKPSRPLIRIGDRYVDLCEDTGIDIGNKV